MSHSPEIVETDVELEPLTQPTGSQNDFLAKNSIIADVHQTVLRGAELREHKARNVITSSKQQKLRIVSVKARGPCDPPNNSIRKATSNKRPAISGPITRSSGHSPSLIFLGPSSSIKRSRSRSQSRKKCDDRNSSGSCREKCPLRIAELAEPSKRHCLNTWKNMPDTLPDYMLDRLQQRIMDQKPVVQLDEAINFFQIKRKRSTSPKRRRKRQEEASNQEIKYLCAVFARNMAKKLIKPINTSEVIAAEMVNLVNVVSSEISNVLKNLKISTIEFTCDNDTIQLEMAAKIAMWIESILKDTGERMLEDELRAKIQYERRMGKEGHIATLIEKYLYCDYKERDLEEEEGPVLDFIDELLENVVMQSPYNSSTDTENELEDGTQFRDAVGDGAEVGDGTDDKVTDEHTSGGTMDQDIESFGVHDINTDEIYYDSNNTQANIANSYNEIDVDSKDITDVLQTEKANKLDDNEQSEQQIDPLKVKDMFQIENANKFQDNEQTENQINSLEVNDMLQPENAYNLEDNEQTEKQINPPQVNDVFEPKNAIELEGSKQTEEQGNSMIINDGSPPENENKIKDNEQIEKQINPLQVNDTFLTENVNKLEDNGQTDKQRTPVTVNDMEENLDVEQVGINTNIEEPSGVLNFDDELSPQMSITDLNEYQGMETYKDDRKVKFTSLDSEYGELGESSVRSANIEDKTSDSWIIPSDIKFSPPNHGLLSDADESWPDKHAHGIGYKFSESVSKSVTSLGHIKENDERFIENAEHDDETNKETSRISMHFTEPEYTARIDYDIETKPSETIMETERENLVIWTNTNSSMTDIVSNSKVTNKYSEDESVYTNYEIPLLKVEIKKKPSPAFNETDTKMQSGIPSVQERSDSAFNTYSSNNLEKDFSVIDDGTGDSRINVNESTLLPNKNNYPAAISKQNIIYQVPASNRNVFHPSDDALSMSSMLPTKIGQCEAQRWCSDLERTVDNLCHWYKWIDDVCNKVLTLQQKSVLRCDEVKILEIFKEWVDLQSDVNNDADLWNKLRVQTKTALQTYRKKAKPKGVPKYVRSRKDAIIDVCLDIDGLTMWMDSLMTTTEYCMKCKCKYYSKKR